MTGLARRIAELGRSQSGYLFEDSSEGCAALETDGVGHSLDCHVGVPLGQQTACLGHTLNAEQLLERAAGCSIDGLTDVCRVRADKLRELTQREVRRQIILRVGEHAAYAVYENIGRGVVHTASDILL